MCDLFDTKLKNNEYISNYLYMKKINDDMSYKSFDIDSYNENILNIQYEREKDYFNNMYIGIDDNIHLDKDQIKAILSDENYSLIIAGAGTGKTITMASKVKYLVDKKGIDPSKILVITFAKKATLELIKRIQIDFNIPALVTTFHSLGLMYIREIFYNHKCYVVDYNKRNEIFMEYFNEKIFSNKEILKDILNLFNTDNTGIEPLFSKFLEENYNKYDSYNDLFNAYKLKKLNEALNDNNDIDNLKKVINDKIDKSLNSEKVYTIKGELVKSKGEAIIANYLFCNNIDYVYEKIYDKLVTDRRIYRPDFTLNYAGENIYLEYFGMSNYKDNNISTYEKIKNIKEKYHKDNNNKFIKIDYKRNEDIIDTLKNELIKYNFKLKPKSYEEIFMTILDSNKLVLLYKFENLFYNCIDSIKSFKNRSNIVNIVNNYILSLNDSEKEIVKRQFKYIYDFYIYYQKKLYGTTDYGFDFSDMIYYADKYIERTGKNSKLNFEYIIIDEYQDISNDRYEFVKKISNKEDAKIVAVGDDWQSIYGFSGSKVEYTYNFLKYFNGAKLFKINKTYRNSQALVNYAGKFIMKNEMQIKKDLISDKNIYNPIRFVEFKDGQEMNYLKAVIKHINKEFPNEHILILGRTNKIVNNCLLDNSFLDDIGTKVKFVGYEDIDIDLMTMHKSKGLTSDEVILIGLDEYFPLSNKNKFWLENLFLPKIDEEPIEFAEERRLFYVALTRTKNYVYLLVNSDPTKRSVFINELYNIIKEDRV